MTKILFMEIAIIGEGFLGSELENYFSKKYPVILGTLNPKTKSSVKLDATNKKEVENFFNNYYPKIVINTVALASSVSCEKNANLCKKLNYETTKNLAQVCRKFDSKMIFISSSYVFNGLKGNYKETEETSPTNNYAKAKVLAEKEVLKDKSSIVLRTEPMYGFNRAKKQLSFGTGNFEKEVFLGYSKLIRKPVFIEDVSKTIDKLIEAGSSGIFHIAGPKEFNWIDFVEKLANLKNCEDKLKLVDDSNWIVKSPINSSLDTSKIEKLGIKPTSFEKAWKKISNQLDL